MIVAASPVRVNELRGEAVTMLVLCDLRFEMKTPWGSHVARWDFLGGLGGVE